VDLQLSAQAHWTRRATYDLKGVGNDADGLQLLSVVAAVHHH
jgi:hypothetical protein